MEGIHRPPPDNPTYKNFFCQHLTSFNNRQATSREQINQAPSVNHDKSLVIVSPKYLVA